MRSLKLFLILQFIILTSFNFGQENNSKPFYLDFTREAVLIGSGTAAAVTALVILGNVQTITLEEINSLNPADVNGFDRGAIGPYKEDYAGDILLYSAYLLPLTFLANEEMNKDFLDLAVMYGEVLLIQGSINGIVKGTAQRIRPYVYDANSPISEKTTDKARRSFFSGHTSITAAITFFTAKVFTEYIEDNTARILIWSGTVLYPALVALLRVNTHWHFPTDVMAGYVFGALVGYFIPELHKNKGSDNISFNTSYIPGRPLLSIQIKF
jgi:membrane-associated phospholipid phosphatase